MTTTEFGGPMSPSPRSSLPAKVVGVTVLALVLVVGLSWAKWLPYAEKVASLGRNGVWDGDSIFVASDSVPSWTDTWRFTTTYFAAVWKAGAVALLLAAAIDALVPRVWLLKAMNRRTWFGQTFVAGTVALPSMMCTCCTAPVAVGLRQRGVTPAASLAYWIGNPLLNPAVLAFLFLVSPWQFGVVRIVIAAVLVFGGAALVAWLFDANRYGQAAPVVDDSPDPVRVSELPARFLRSLAKFAIVLIPEYIVAVLVVGWLSGWMSSFENALAQLGVAAVIAAAVVGTLLVIPTGGEIPVILALSAAGIGAGVLGALLITLPALSIPSMVLVGRALSWRITVAMAAVVALAGVVAGGLLWFMM